MSLIMISGGSASGKSAYAEGLVRELTRTGPGIYLATMQAAGREAQARIAKHRAMRRDLGLLTVECERALEGVQVPPDSCILLEDLGNLTANVLFGGQEPGTVQASEAAEEILCGVESLHARCAHLVVVTNEVFSGGSAYAGDTDRYLQVLARVNRELAARADRVVEVVCGVPHVRDRKKEESGIQNGICGNEGETSMLFVTGPLASGKQAYVMQLFGWDASEFEAKAVRDVQDLAAKAVRETLEQRAASLEDRLRRLADDLARRQVVIATEVGGGIVPLDPMERKEREAAGRLACMLAERAQTVVRVYCGLPQILKELPRKDTRKDMRIWLIRHGKTELGEQGRYQGRTDTGLSENGRNELRRAGLCPEHVYVSPALRARETAKILFPEARQIIVEDLREMDFGDFEGRHWREMENDAAYRAWVDGGCTGRCPGGEDRASFSARVCRAFAGIIGRERENPEKEETQPVCIVAHGGTQMAVLERWGVPDGVYFQWQTPCGRGWHLCAGDLEEGLRVVEKADFLR